MIRVLNITEEGRGGGPLKRIVRLLPYTDKKFETYVVLPHDAVKFEEDILACGGRPIRMRLSQPSRSPILFFKYFLFFIPQIIALLRLIRRLEIDIVHCNGSWQIKGVIASRLSGCVSIWHMNDTYQPGLVKKSFRLISRWATAYIFASKRSLEYYSLINPSIIKRPHTIIPAPVDTSVFHPSPEPNPSNGGPIKILTVGYINPNKGLRDLIEAASNNAFLGSRPIGYSVAGAVLPTQQTYFRELSVLIQSLGLKDFEFLGHRNDIADLLRSCDLFICSSIRESSPMSVWEAMACGCHVLSSDVGDLDSLFNQYSCGHLYSAGSSSELSAKIPEVLLMEGKSTYKKNARKAAIELFSVERVAKKHCDFYSRLVNLTFGNAKG